MKCQYCDNESTVTVIKNNFAYYLCCQCYFEYENQEGKKRSIAEVVAEQVVYLDWPKKEEEIGLPDDLKRRIFRRD